MRLQRRSARPDVIRRDAVVAAGVVAVLGFVFYLSLTALGGFPWQSKYSISADVPSAQRLQVNDDVRIGGVRVGRVADVKPMPPSGPRQAFTRLKLALDSSRGPLPADTLVKVRPASVLGAAYVDLQAGHSSRTVPEGGRLALRNASNTVDLTDLFQVFDRETARRFQETTGEMALGLAGQGASLNATFEGMRRLLAPMTRVLAVAAEPGTRLSGFVREYDRFVSALAPVRERLAGMIEGGATTFDAMAGERVALGETIEEFPEAAASATRALDTLRPSLDRLSGLAVELTPSARHLPGAVSALNGALIAGAPAIRSLPLFSRRLQRPLRALTHVAPKASTDGAIRKLTETIDSLKPTLEITTPAQVYCNALGNWLQGFGSVWKVGSGIGPGIVSFMFTHGGAQGEVFQTDKPSPNMGINYLPHENKNECESGNELHDGVTQMLANPPGFQGTAHPLTAPPPDSLARARKAGLVDLPEDAK